MKNRDRSRVYGKAEAERFVKYLLCWTFVNPTDAIKRRDPQEYREALCNLIQVNANRIDQVSSWETAAAYNELGNIDK